MFLFVEISDSAYDLFCTLILNIVKECKLKSNQIEKISDLLNYYRSAICSN
jgi:hypothetical protein